MDSRVVADPTAGALLADSLLLLRVSPGAIELLSLLQRQCRRKHPGGSHPARLLRVGRARQRGPVVVQPRAPAGGGLDELRRALLAPARVFPPPAAPRPVGPGPDGRPGNPCLCRPVAADRPPA